MTTYRINLDKQMDAGIIARIKGIANGGSENNALRFLVRYWNEAEKCQKVTINRPESDQFMAGSGQKDDAPQVSDDEKFSAALSSIDEEWGV